MARFPIHTKLLPSVIAAHKAAAKAIANITPPDPFDVAANREAYCRERRFWQGDGPDLASVTDIAIPSHEGTVRTRFYRPIANATLPVIVYCHGGGWYLGDLETHDRLCRRLAKQSGAAVAAVDYRLAPEHKHPAQINDARAVLRHLRTEGAQYHIDGTRMAAVGDSAGAHCVLASALTDRNDGLPPLRALALFYGYFGLADGRSYRLYGGPEDGLSAEDMDHMLTLTLATREARSAPDFNLLRQSMKGLPPTRVIEAELDPLADDSAALATLINAEGGTAEHIMVAGVPHAFIMWDKLVPEAAAEIDRTAAFLADHLKV